MESEEVLFMIGELAMSGELRLCSRYDESGAPQWYGAIYKVETNQALNESGWPLMEGRELQSAMAPSLAGVIMGLWVRVTGAETLKPLTPDPLPAIERGDS